MTDEFDDRSRVKTRAGSTTAPKGRFLLERIAKFGEKYSRLLAGKPFLLTRQIIDPAFRPPVIILMTMAAKPVQLAVVGMQMLTQSGFEFPVERYAASGGGGDIFILDGPLVATLGELADPTTRAYFGEREICDWVQRVAPPLDPSWGKQDDEARLYARLSEMATMVGTSLPPLR